MARKVEFTRLFSDPDPLVRMQIQAFPSYVRFQDLGINNVLVSSLAEETGIKRIIITSNPSRKPLLLDIGSDVDIPSLVQEVFDTIEGMMPEESNLVLPFPYPTSNSTPSLPSVGAVLVINSDTMERRMRVDPYSRFNIRDVASWTPYLDRSLRQTFLSVGSSNLKVGLKFSRRYAQSMKLMAKMVQLRLDVSRGPLLGAVA